MPTPLLAADMIGRREPLSEKWLLRDISLTLVAGDQLALAGPSGAGKTVLMRCLAMLDSIDSGYLKWLGQSLDQKGIPEYRAQVIYLHQRPALFAGTVEQNLRMPFTFAVHRDKIFDLEVVTLWLTLLGRDHLFLQKNARDLSGGERQITALIRALLLSPRVLLLDEATAALDSKTALALGGLIDLWMRDLPDQRGCIWVGHDQVLINQLTSRRLTLEAGQMRVP